MKKLKEREKLVWRGAHMKSQALQKKKKKERKNKEMENHVRMHVT